MGAIIRLIVASSLVWLVAACEGSGGAVSMPPFASALPGRASIVAWSDAGAMPAELDARLREIVEDLPLRGYGHDDCIALLSPEDVQVGWPRLKDSINFQDAMSKFPADAPHRLYVDLQQVVSMVSGLWGEERWVSLAARHVLEVLQLKGFRFLVLGFRPQEGRWIGRGRLATLATIAGIPRLLTAEVASPLIRPVAEGDVQIEIALDGRALVGLLRDLLTIEGNFVGVSVVNLPGQVFDAVMSQMTGRASLRIDGDGGILAISVRDGEELLTSLEDLRLPGGIENLLYDPRVRFEPERVLLSEPAGSELSTTGVPIPAGSFFWLRIEGMELTLRRISATEIGVELDLAQ